MTTSDVTDIKSRMKGVVIALMYGISSVSMAFINKATLNIFNFNYPIFLVSCQMLLSVVVLEILRLKNFINIPRYSLERGRTFILPSTFYAVHSVMALSALSGMNIPMYGVIKRCAPLVILGLGTLLLGKGFPSRNICTSVALITAGCIVAGFGDLAFELKAYGMGVASVVTQALYLVLVQKLSHDLSATETLHLNSYNTLPLLLVSSVLFGELIPALQHFDYHSRQFIILFLTTIAMGVLLNYLLFLCTTFNCALTTSITGTLKSILQTAIGMFTFGGVSINVFTVVGIGMNIGGGVLYSYSKYSENQKKATGDLKKIRSSSFMSNGVAAVSQPSTVEIVDETQAKNVTQT